MVASKKDSHDSHDLKPDITEEELQRLYTKASTQRFDENPRYPMSPTGGVIPMALKGRFANERERLGPDFDDVQRSWRIRWIQDQKLHPLEPLPVKQLYYEYHNPIRRFYRKPLDLLEEYMSKYMSSNTASISRKIVGRGFLIYLGALTLWYYAKYNRAHWENSRGPRIFIQRENVYPGDPNWPNPERRTESWQHWDRGFHKRTVHKEF